MSAPDRETHFEPGKLWSLWDMAERIGLDVLWQSASEFVDSYNSIYMAAAEVTAGEPGRSLTQEESSTLAERLGRLQKLCRKLGLGSSERLIGYKLQEPPTSVGEMNMLWLAVKADMKTQLFLSVPDQLAKFYEREDVLDEKARQAFPQGNQELRDAGTCVAMGLDTACVFHCMRALEYGLKALATDVSVTIDSQNWQNVIDQIDKAIRDLGPTLPRGDAKADRLQFLSEAASEFRYFKDAWRNHVSHNKIRYQPNQATKILAHVADFLAVLSAQLKET